MEGTTGVITLLHTNPTYPPLHWTAAVEVTTPDTPRGTGSTRPHLTKTQLRLKRKQKIRQKRNQLNRRHKERRRRHQSFGATSPRISSPQSPKGTQGHSFRVDMTRAAISIHHICTMMDIKTQGRDYRGIRGLINRFRANIILARPDQIFYRALTRHCDRLYQDTVKNLEDLHIRNALRSVEKAMVYYHAPMAELDLVTALSIARVHGDKLHPLDELLTGMLLDKHIANLRHNNPNPPSHSSLRHIIAFETPPEDSTLPTHIAPLNGTESDYNDIALRWIISQEDLPVTHIHIPLPTLKFGDWPPFQEFPQAYTYTGGYPQAPQITILNLFHSLDIHRRHPPQSFPKNRVRPIHTDLTTDKLSLTQLRTRGELPQWAGNITNAPLAYPEPLIADSVSNSEFYRDYWYPQIAKAYLTLAIKDPKVLYKICNPHSQSFEHTGTENLEWQAYPIKLMNLAIWHVRHLLFDFVAYFVDSSSRFSRFRAIMDHYPVQGTLAGTLCHLLIKEDEAGQITFQPPPELNFRKDFSDTEDELIWDYMEGCSPQPSTKNELALRPITPPPTWRGTPLGLGLGSSSTSGSPNL